MTKTRQLPPSRIPDLPAKPCSMYWQTSCRAGGVVFWLVEQPLTAAQMDRAQDFVGELHAFLARLSAKMDSPEYVI